MHLPRQRVHRRLRLLRKLEFINVVLIPGVLVLGWWDWSESWLARFPALLAVVIFLLQGSFYWQMKNQALASKLRNLPSARVRIFEALKLFDQVLLVLLFVNIAVLQLAGWSNPGDLAWGTGLTICAALEYVNYFHWQLTHDQVSDVRYLFRWRRLRESPLASDLRRARERAA